MSLEVWWVKGMTAGWRFGYRGKVWGALIRWSYACMAKGWF
jgi:hypothetical protein